MAVAVHPDYYPFKTKPYSHQKKILMESWQKKAWAFLMEMGTGKSKVFLDNCGLLFMNGEIDTVVIMAKKGEYANWKYAEIPAHFPDELPHESYLFSTVFYRKKAGREAFKEFSKADSSRLRFFIINIEALATAPGKEALAAIYKTSEKGVMIGVDESTCVKHHKSQRSKQCYLWAAKSKYRRIMTGSSITQSPLDIFGQSLVLGKGILGPSSYYAFRGRYAVMERLYLGNRTVDTVAGYQRLDELHQVIKTFSHRILKSECLDLPEKIYSKLYVEMTPEQTRVYNELRETAMTTLESGEEISITNALALVTKLHQVACGQLKLEDGSYRSFGENRIEALLSKLEQHEGKAIIWATYNQNIMDIRDALRREYSDEAVAIYKGGVSDEDRKSAISRFQDKSDPLRFFVANHTAAYGTTLTAADLVIYYSNSNRYEHRAQSEDRAHRIGQTKNVHYVDMIAQGTVDERIIQILRECKSLSDYVQDGRSIREWI